MIDSIGRQHLYHTANIVVGLGLILGVIWLLWFIVWRLVGYAMHEPNIHQGEE